MKGPGNTRSASEGTTRRSLLLHVGTHKTGTTSIQAMLADQASELHSRGVELWLETEGQGQARKSLAGALRSVLRRIVGGSTARPVGKRSNAFGLAHSFLRPELATPMRLRNRPGLSGQAEDNAYMIAFRNHVLASDASVHLVSSETFCFARTEAEQTLLRDFLAALFVEVRPILVLRQDADWRSSWAAQLKKMGVSDSLTGLSGEQDAGGDWYFDRDAIAAFWAGIGPVTVLDYDKVMKRDGSILPAFLDAIDQSDLPVNQEWFLNRRKGDLLAEPGIQGRGAP